MRSRFQTSFHLAPIAPRLPLFWRSWGEEEVATTGYRWHGLKRGQADHVLWQLTISGEGRIKIGSEPPCRLRAGEGFVARIPSDHCYYWPEGGEPWRFVWAMWYGPALMAIWDAMSKTSVRIIAQEVESAPIAKFRALIRARPEESPASSTENAVEAFRFLLAACTSPARHEVRHRRSPVRALTPSLEKLARRDPQTTVGKDGLAHRLHLSRYQLYRALKEESGVGPKEWQAQRRLAEACRLLRATRKPVAEIALRIGLPDANYFARFFRLRTGLTPSDWRRLFSARGR